MPGVTQMTNDVIRKETMRQPTLPCRRTHRHCESHCELTVESHRPMSPRPKTGLKPMVTMGMVIVAGHLIVDPDERDAYLEGCREVVELARRTDGCLDFAITADLLDPARVNVYERWDSQDAVEAFRGDGVQGEQAATIRAAQVSEYGAVEERVLS